jgi:diguanylate cyclase
MGSIKTLNKQQVKKKRTKRLRLEANDDAPIMAIKRRVYMASTVPGVFLVMALWVVSYTFGELGVVDRFSLPLLCTIIVFLLILLRLNRIKLYTFESSVFCLVFVFFLSKTYMDFYNLIQAGDTLASSNLIYIPLLYMLGFTLLGKRKGFVSALVFLISLMFLGLIFVNQSAGTFAIIQNALQMLELLLVSISSILLLYLLAYIGEQHFKSHVQAEVNARLANTDSLTQVDNRRHLEVHIDREINRAARQKQPLAILMLDIDHFKKINDQFGHAAGDSVLINIAQMIRQNLRSMDHFGRWGGDEFICVASNTDLETAKILAERIRQEVEAARFPDTPTVKCSIGIAPFIKGDSLSDLLSRADKGLMQAKAAGRNCVVCILPGEGPLG